MAGEETELRAAGAASRPPPISIPGIKLGKQLGEGGMAGVYEGFDQGFSPPRRVAVKLMGADISADPEFRKRFGREAAVVGDFRHDNIVRVYASGEAGGAKYIVMEYLAGGSLAQRVSQGPMPVADALRIGISLSDALAYSHARDVIHRDFKPANVLLTAEGKPILSDFGVAKNLSSAETGLTRHAMVIGAPRYMSPEQSLGEGVTDRTDIYSLGLTLFEMLAGNLPPMNLRVLRDPKDARELAPYIPDTPRRVVDLIGRCLQVAPEDRPSAEECRRELESALTDGDRPAESAPKPSNRRSFPIAAGVIVAVLIAAAIYTQARKPAPVATDATAEIVFAREPLSTRIYLDDVEVPGTSIGMARGEHTLVAVAPGHYGQVRRLTLNDLTGRTVPLNLPPLQLPSEEEYATFLELDDRERLSPTDLDRVTEETLKEALHSKAVSPDSALNAWLEDYRLLAKRGDARAPVTLLLVQSMRAGGFSRSLITDELRASSAGGDAMASFFLAMAQREALSQATDLVPSNPTYRDYCALLVRAESQGWRAVAGPQRQMDRCPN